MIVEVYSDGASGARGGKPGGWAYVLVIDNVIHQVGYGGEVATTNNLMEVRGAYEGLLVAQSLPQGHKRVTLISDSQYCLGLAQGTYQPKKNVTEATALREAMISLNARVRWVPGHTYKRSRPWEDQPKDVLLNERCDQLAGLGKEEAVEKSKLFQNEPRFR